MDHIGHPRYARSRTCDTHRKRESVDHGMLKLVNWNKKKARKIVKLKPCNMYFELFKVK